MYNNRNLLSQLDQQVRGQIRRQDMLRRRRCTTGVAGTDLTTRLH
jgi:hypothetical protein